MKLRKSQMKVKININKETKNYIEKLYALDMGLNAKKDFSEIPKSYINDLISKQVKNLYDNSIGRLPCYEDFIP